MRYADTLNVYSKLREGFEEKEAKIITLAIENAFEEADEILLKEVATKEDLAKLRTELNNLAMATKEDLAQLQAATKEDLAQLRTEFKEDILNLKTYISNFKAEIIKWMFLFWIGQITLIFGIVKFVK